MGPNITTGSKRPAPLPVSGPGMNYETKGNIIMAEIVAMFAIACCLAVYGGFKYFNSSNSEYKAYTQATQDIRSDFSSFMKLRTEDRAEIDKFKELNEINTRRFDEVNKKIETLTGETERNKKRSLILNGKLSRDFKFEKPVPVTIVERTPSKNVTAPKNVASNHPPRIPIMDSLKKSASQIQGLSK